MYTNTLFATLNARSNSSGMPDDTENNHTDSVSLGHMRPRATEFDSQIGSKVSGARDTCNFSTNEMCAPTYRSLLIVSE